MIRALLALLLPPVAMWLALLALGLRRRDESRTITAVTALGCGVGLSSITTFWLMAHLGLRGPAFVASDAVLWIAVAALGWWHLPATRSPLSQGGAGSNLSPSRSPLTWIACALFSLVALVAIGTTVTEYMAAPHGQWDAWAVWNQKARFLIRAGSRWTDSQALPWSNPSHPLLVSTSVARLWSYAGAELTAIPAMFSLTLGMGIVAAVIGALDPRRSRAWLAGAIVTAPSTFGELVAAQTADLPTSFFVVASLIVFFDVRAESAMDAARPWKVDGATLLGAMLAGCAAWTKNEGLVLVALIGVATLWRAFSGWQLRPLVWAAVGVAAPLVSIVWLKTVVSTMPPGYFSENDTTWVLLGRMLSFDRNRMIVELVTQYWLKWGGPAAAGSLPLVTVAMAWAAIRSGRASRAIAVVVVAMMASYYASWLATSIDMQWLLTTSVDRLLIQLWPSMVVAAFWSAPGQPATGTAFASGLSGMDNPKAR